MKKYIFPVLALAALTMTSCENDEKVFDDYQDGTSVCFPYQYPVRTIMLGTSIDESLDNSLDNAHKFKVFAAQGGAYKTKSMNVSVAVDNDLCKNLYFEDGVTPVEALPESYYNIASTNITKWSNYMGSFEVELTDAFFADPKAVTTTYVLPVVIKSATGADRILSGSYDTEANATAPSRTNTDSWDTAPMDYTLYCVRYVNPYEAYYLVKGSNTDILQADIVQITTASLTDCNYSILLKDGKKINVSEDGATAVALTLKFDGNSCKVYEGATEIGSGSYASKAMEVAPNIPVRDVLSLNYTVQGVSVQEELVMQRRGDFAGTVVEYTPVYKN